MFRGVIIAMVLIVSAPLVSAQDIPKTGTEDAELKKIYLYQWIDGKGVVHITDSLEKVPKQYRDKATKLEQPQEEPGQPGLPNKGLSPYRGFSDVEGIDADRKAEWQQRMKEARARLADVEKRYRELDQKRLDAVGQWGGIAAGHREGVMESERIEQEMEQLKPELDAARNQVEVVIPEEARKAGVPPGWLRE